MPLPRPRPPLQCYQYGLPSLCHHKARSATAALSTLDVRCGRRGLTQRFGLHHRSLYPRLATAREHYIFTSHAGTPLEVRHSWHGVGSLITW